jgi:formate hydrogenlyase subunit 3/multisubunit Na+/H+ antiporter MnhD subunit
VGATAFLLLATVPVLALLGTRTLVRAMPSPALAALGLAVMIPAGAYVLVRLYELGQGQLPNPAVGYVLIVVGGLAALGSGLSAFWEPDLGSATARLLQGIAALALVAAGLGGPAGLLALVVIGVSAPLVGAGMLALVEAGRGRLPSSGAGVMLALVLFAALAGLPVGLGFDLRALLVHAALDQGGVRLVLAMPALLAIVVLAGAMVSCARFSGGEPVPARNLPRLGLLAAAAVGLSLFQRPLLETVLAPAVIPAAGLDLDRARIAISVASPPLPVELALVGTVVAAAVVLGLVMAGARRPRWWPRARSLLPPRLAVAPRIAMIQSTRRAGGMINRVATAAQGRQPLLSAVASLAVVIAGAIYLLR